MRNVSHVKYDPALADAILEVRELGFRIGLHSGGIYPKRLAAILPLLDWIGLDVKAPFDERYEPITGVADSGAQTLASAQAVIAGDANYELRTTIHPTLVHEDEVMGVANALSGMGVTDYALQVFRPQGCGSGALNAGYPSANLVSEVSALFPRFTLRRG